MTSEMLPEAVGCGQLTDALRRSGVLDSGRVSDVAVVNSRPTILSQVIRLRLSYEGPATDAPHTVIFKNGHPDRADNGWSSRHREVAFYTQVGSAMRGRLIPRCYEAHSDEETKTWHLVLEDLTETHIIATAWPLPPTIEQCASIVEARARFHAVWWDDPRLGTSVGTWSDAEATDRYVQSLAEQFARFCDRLGDNLPREQREIYERLLDAAPRLLARYHTHRNVTIVQGDSHVWNSFLPRDGGDDVRFFDWDSWHIGVGSSDLAYMMAIHWYPDRRARLERLMLDRYHAALVSHGVDGYDRRALNEDYRLSVLWQITTPVRQAAYNIPPVFWWNNLERVLLAVDDLGCRDLLT
jgi:Ecdysteroid kinase-like family